MNYVCAIIRPKKRPRLIDDLGPCTSFFQQTNNYLRTVRDIEKWHIIYYTHVSYTFLV